MPAWVLSYLCEQGQFNVQPPPAECDPREMTVLTDGCLPADLRLTLNGRRQARTVVFDVEPAPASGGEGFQAVKVPSRIWSNKALNDSAWFRNCVRQVTSCRHEIGELARERMAKTQTLNGVSEAIGARPQRRKALPLLPGSEPRQRFQGGQAKHWT